MIEFPCPHCEKPLRVKDELGGKKGACPTCKKALVVPKAEGPAPLFAVREESDIKCPFCGARQAPETPVCGACKKDMRPEPERPRKKKAAGSDPSGTAPAAPRRGRFRRAIDGGDGPDETGDSDEDRPRPSKKDKARQTRDAVLAGAFVLTLLFFFALEFAFYYFFCFDGALPRQASDKPPQPIQLGFAVMMLSTGVVAFFVLRMPGVGSWAHRTIDTSRMTGWTFWGLFLCCPGPGLMTPVMLSLLAVSAGSYFLFDE